MGPETPKFPNWHTQAMLHRDRFPVPRNRILIQSPSISLITVFYLDHVQKCTQLQKIQIVFNLDWTGCSYACWLLINAQVFGNSFGGIHSDGHVLMKSWVIRFSPIRRSYNIKSLGLYRSFLRLILKWVFKEIFPLSKEVTHFSTMELKGQST